MRHLHHFRNDPDTGIAYCTGSSAVPAPCGEPQRYRPPRGQASEISVFIPLADLRLLLGLVEQLSQATDGEPLCSDEAAAIKRLEALL